MLISLMDGSLVWSNQHHQSGTLMPSGPSTPSLRGEKRRSNPYRLLGPMDCFVEPVIGRAFARPVGTAMTVGAHGLPPSRLHQPRARPARRRILVAVRPRQIGFRTHLDQPRRGALELVRLAALGCDI